MNDNRTTQKNRRISARSQFTMGKLKRAKAFVFTLVSSSLPHELSLISIAATVRENIVNAHSPFQYLLPIQCAHNGIEPGTMLYCAYLYQFSHSTVPA